MAKAKLGTLEFYRDLRETNFLVFEGDKTKFCPRNPSNADQVTVDLRKVTTADVICWFEHDLSDFQKLPVPNVRYEINPQFRPDHPVGYQYSRVQVADNGYCFQNTRQAMCLFCPDPLFCCLTAELLMHFEKYHPHEIPFFVRCVIEELDLSYKPKKHGQGRADPSLYGLRHFWPEFEYRGDAKSNLLRFAPRPGTTEYVVKLAEVSEKLLVPWFHRDINDYQKYRHANVRYKLNPFFNPQNPEAVQILRVMIDDDGNELKRSKQYMCLYCLCPFFGDAFLSRGILAHMAGYHWPLDLPREETFNKILHDV